MILILGKGWTGTYIYNECINQSIQCLATTRDGRENTLKFNFDTAELADFELLPIASHIIITFPIIGAEKMNLMCSQYQQSHSTTSTTTPKWILFGSTSVFLETEIITRKSPIDLLNERGIAEMTLMESWFGVVLSCSGLWGGERKPKNWINRVARTKKNLEMKGALHLIHGQDIAKSVLVLINKFEQGQRWILTDLRVYDWWDVALAYSSEVHGVWVRELMNEHKVSGLPRSFDKLKRTLDGREYWDMIGCVPSHSLLSY